MRHFLDLKGYSKKEILDIIDLGRKIKDEFKNGIKHKNFDSKTLAMIFEKSSTRTRVSFEVGAYQLGGHALFLSNKDIQLGRGEPLSDTAKVISSMVDMVMIRTFGHDRIEEFAKYSAVPVINGLTDSYHPVQLMADYMTMLENGIGVDDATLRVPIVAYVGDGNNMAHSWIELSAILGFELRIASPKEYMVDKNILESNLIRAQKSGAKILITQNVEEALKGANVITTDTWASMGQEDEKEARKKAFKGYYIDDKAMSLGDDAIFLHCLPAYRGQEVSEDVLEGASSRVYQEAQNRLHAQKGVMAWLLDNQ